MSDEAATVTEATERLQQDDATLKMIELFDQKFTDEKAAELVDCLIAHPNAVKRLYLDKNELSDETGVKLAQYIAASSTIKTLDLKHNRFGLKTYLALAEALHVNTSLRWINLTGNKAEDKTCVDAAFMEALRVNPKRHMDSDWRLHSHEKDSMLNAWSSSNDFLRLSKVTQ